MNTFFKKNLFFLFFIFIIFSFNRIKPVVYGSELLVSVQPLVTLPTSVTNELRGFGWFRSGFTLEDAATECEFNSVFPVSGEVNFNGGTLTLSRDLFFNNITSLLSFGTVIGGGNLLSFCSSITALPNDSECLDDVVFSFEHDLVLNTTLHLKNDCIIDGKGNTLVLGDQGALIIDQGAEVVLKDIEIEGVSGQNIQCEDDTASIILDTVRLVQSGDYTFGSGSMSIMDEVTVFGNYVFSYESERTSTITAQSTFQVTDGIDLQMGITGYSSRLSPFYFEDQTAGIRINNSNLTIRDSGVDFTRGTLIFDREVVVDIASTTTENGVVIGNKVSASDDMYLLFNPGTEIRLNSGHVTFKDISSEVLQAAAHKSSRLLRALGSHLLIDQDIIFPSMAVETISNSVEPTLVTDGHAVYYQNALIRLPNVEFDITGALYGPLAFLLAGGEQIFLRRGAFPMGLAVAGPSNLLQGSGSVTGPTTLVDSSTELIFLLQGSLDGSITLNGGTITLSNDLKFGSTGTLSGSGLIDLATFTLTFGSKEISWSDDRLINGSDATIVLNSNLSLSNTMTIQGSLTIDGNGHSIIMETGGNLVVDEQSSLELRDLSLENLADNNVRCLDNDGQIILNDVSCIQSTDYTFTVGSLSFMNNVSLIGSSTFSYESVRTSTIVKNSRLFVTQDMHFCIGRNQSGIEPLCFEDDTSTLGVDNGTLVISENGIALTRGILEFYNSVQLDIKSTSTETGLIWGNGIAADDIKIRFNSGASVNQLSGHLVYNNGLPDGIESTLIESRLIRQLGSHLYIAKDLTVPSLTIEVPSLAVEQIQAAPGVTVLNSNSRAEAPIGVFQVTAQRYTDTVLLLNGDGVVSILRGVFPRGVVVSGTGNSIVGNGDTMSPIIFLSPAAELSMYISGQAQANITLNGGTLLLAADLSLGPDALILGPGTVNLATSGLLTGRQDTTWATNIIWEGTGGFVGLQSNAILNASWTFNGDCAIDGLNNTLELSTSGEIIVADNSTLSLKNITLKNVEGTKIRCLSDTSKILLDDVTFLLSDNLEFSTGSIEILDDVDFSGSYTFLYNSSRTSTIDLKSTWRFSDDITFKAGKTSLDDGEPVAFEGSSSTLALENCTLCITNSGATITKGRITCERDVVVDIISSTTMEGLILGDGTVSGSAYLELYAGSTIRLIRGALVYDVPLIDGIVSRSQTAKLFRSNESNIFVKQNLLLSNLTVEAEPLATLNVAAGKTLSYDRFVALQNDGEFEIAGSRVNFFTNLLSGDNSIFLNKGLLASYLSILNTNNILQGNGNITGQIILQNSLSSVDYSVNGFMNNNIVLAGGVLNLNGNLDFGSGALIIGPGMVNLGPYKLSTGPKDLNWTSDIFWEGQNAEITLGANISLSATWTVNTSCVINGDGNELDLSSGGRIEITDGSNLEFKNIVLSGLNDTNLSCLTDASSIEFNDTELVLDGSFLFNVGSISFEGDVSLLGTSTFVYGSSQTSTIQADSGLFVSEGIHLCMGRYDVSNGIEPLKFVDATSSLNFDQSSFIITSSGMQLTYGTVTFNRDASFEILSTTTQYGLIWGDGTSDHDITIQFNPGAAVIHKSGYFVYNNGSPDRIYAPSQNASYKRLVNSRTYIAQNVLFPAFTVEAESILVPPLELKPGVSLEFRGSKIVTPIGIHTLKGLQQEVGTYEMNGNADTLTIDQGTMPFNIKVIDDNNLLGGAGRVSGLISLQDQNSELSIDLNGDILNTIQLSGGKVSLSRDIKLGSGVIFEGPGRIDLDVYTLDLSQKETTWDQSLEWSGQGGVFSINGILDLSSTWTIQDSCVIQGNGNTINMGNNGEIVIDDNATLLLKNVRLKGVKNSNIRCLTDTSQLILDDVVWLQDADFSFTKGSITFIDDVDFAGEYTFLYASDQTSTIDVKSSWNITNRITLDIGKQSTNGQEPLAFNDLTSVLALNNCTLSVNEYGMRGTKGTVTAERDVAVEVVSTTTSSGLIFGDGTTESDMIFELYPGTTVRFLTGATTYDVTLSDGIRSRSKTAKIIRTNASTLCVAQDLQLANMTVEGEPLSTLIVKDGKTLSYNRFVAEQFDGEFEITGSRINAFSNLLSGDNSIFVNKGILAPYTFVSGTGNIMQGQGNVTGGIILQDGSSELTYSITGLLVNNIMLNGGQFILAGNLNFAQDQLVIGPGIMNLSIYEITFGLDNLEFTTPIYWDGDDATVNLNADYTLSQIWTFSGSNIINGNGSSFIINPNGGIVVEKGSTLVLKNIRILGINSNNIKCCDDYGQIILQNTSWLQDSDYTFSTGSLLFDKKVTLGGESTHFIYQSSQTSTVLSESTLKFDLGFTFSYDPIAIVSKELLEFIDETSILVLNGGTLHTTITGLQLKKGKIIVDKDSFVSSEVSMTIDGDEINEGIIFGGDSAEDDCIVDIFDGITLNCLQGSVHYRNKNSESWIMRTDSSILYMHPNTRLNLFETLVLGPGGVTLGNNTIIAYDSGVDLVGTIRPLGNYEKVDIVATTTGGPGL